jgi:hypothetical protein
MSDSDLRLLNLMTQALDSFLAAEISLHELLGSLSFLLTHLEEISENCRDDFQENWLLLEMVNAEVREQDRKLTEAERQYTSDKAKHLKDLVQIMKIR